MLSRLFLVQYFLLQVFIKFYIHDQGKEKKGHSTSMDEREFFHLGDKLILRGVEFHGFHGVYLEEKSQGQKFVVDVDAWMDLQEAGKTDVLTDTVSYGDIYRIIKDFKVHQEIFLNQWLITLP